jgi:all-trans-nonaprenyl-diphosphate synthase
VGWLLMRVCLSCCLCSDITSLSTRKAVVGSPPPSISKPVELQTKISLAEIVAPVAEDLVVLNDNLQLVVGAQNPLLMSAAKQIFGAGGKRMRPALIFLVSKATAELAGLKYLLLSQLYCSSHQYANIIQVLNISLVISYMDGKPNQLRNIVLHQPCHWP